MNYSPRFLLMVPELDVNISEFFPALGQTKMTGRKMITMEMKLVKVDQTYFL